ncbi:hypothetical protein BVRB_038550, partial [Beta vulgaris subsp. vulgaris]
NERDSARTRAAAVAAEQTGGWAAPAIQYDPDRMCFTQAGIGSVLIGTVINTIGALAIWSGAHRFDLQPDYGLVWIIIGSLLCVFGLGTWIYVLYRGIDADCVMQI